MQGSNFPGSEGLIPRAFEYIFSRLSSDFVYKIKCKYHKLIVGSYVEIYNEMIFDLLSDGGNKQLQLREDSKRGIVFVEGASEELLDSPQEALQVFWRGCSNRTVAATMLNRESSRSHSVFTLFITSERKGNDINGLKDVRTSRFNLVDLAGSERQATTQTAGVRLKEAGNINRSLLALANVINALALADSRHAPYRDSKLTFLLRDSLGGNSKTAVIATVSPTASCQGETLSTLRFAQRAKLVQNRPTLNQDVWGTLPELQAEIIRLRNLLQKQAHQQEEQAQPEVQVKPIIVEYEFNTLAFSLAQQQKANDRIRLLEERLQSLQEGNFESAEILRLKARIEELESLEQVQTCLEYKFYGEELLKRLPADVPMQSIINDPTIVEEREKAVKEANDALKAQYHKELSLIKEGFEVEHAKKIAELEHRVKQLQAENEHRMEMFQMELEMERKSAERMAAENAILKSQPFPNAQNSEEALRKSLEEQSQMIEKLQKEIQNLQPKKEIHLEERIQFLSFSLQNAQAVNEHLIAKHAVELSNLTAFVEQQRLEIEHMKAENDKLMQHKNFKQKLQYHVKIKQENNELREEVARLQALLSTPNKP